MTKSHKSPFSEPDTHYPIYEGIDDKCYEPEMKELSIPSFNRLHQMCYEEYIGKTSDRSPKSIEHILERGSLKVAKRCQEALGISQE